MQTTQTNGKATQETAKNGVGSNLTVVSSSPMTINEKLSKIAELEKAKSYYSKIKEREELLNDLDFSDANRNQGLTIIDSAGLRFEVTAANVIKEVVDILLNKLRVEKDRIETHLINATI